MAHWAPARGALVPPDAASKSPCALLLLCSVGCVFVCVSVVLRCRRCAPFAPPLAVHLTHRHTHALHAAQRAALADCAHCPRAAACCSETIWGASPDEKARRRPQSADATTPAPRVAAHATRAPLLHDPRASKATCRHTDESPRMPATQLARTCCSQFRYQFRFLRVSQVI